MGRPRKIKTEEIEKPKEISAEKDTGLFHVCLKLINGIYYGEGETIIEAVEMLKPAFVRGKGTVSVSQGEKKCEIVLFMPVIRRLLCNKDAKIIFQKRALLIMK